MATECNVVSSETSIFCENQSSPVTVSTSNKKLIRLLDATHVVILVEDEILGYWDYRKYTMPLKVLLKIFIQLGHGNR